MGKLIQTFTFDRNTLKRNQMSSAEAVLNHIDLIKSGDPLDKTASNIIGALSHYMGVFDKDDDKYHISAVGEAFLRLASSNKEDAYQWLLTRSLWRFSVPNGTECKANNVAISSGIHFNLFVTTLRLLVNLQALPQKQRFFFHEEFCQLFDLDSNWTKPPELLFNDLLMLRAKSGLPAHPRRLLDDLEPTYGIPRDNLNGFINKAFFQTGLLEAAIESGSPIAIAVLSNLTDVAQRRLRYILDNPISPEDTKETWKEFLSLHADDLPQEVDVSRHGLPAKVLYPKTLDKFLDSVEHDFATVGLKMGGNIIRRFISSILTKPFVILTGLSGSGKTKLAQAFAAWITDPIIVQQDPFAAGNEIKSDKISYFVESSDQKAVIFMNKEDSSGATKVCLPRELIAEWVEAIEENAYTRETPARRIRETVASKTKFSTQLNSFETHLKAASFAVIEQTISDKMPIEAFRIVPVGADWDNNENLLGYPDALRADKQGYLKPANKVLDLLIQASLPENSDRPFFLILDEMNLSHVERYFADFLSAMESGVPLELHHGPGLWGDQRDVPAQFTIPDNLFIVGTVNIDETTYLFSPKVLDRANVVDFKVSKNDIGEYLTSVRDLDLGMLKGRGAVFAQAFVQAAKLRNVGVDKIAVNTESDGMRILSSGSSPEKGEAVGTDMLSRDLLGIFEELEKVGSEYGYRTVAEIKRFFFFYTLLDPESAKYTEALDAQVMQKVLPKLHGSIRKLDPVLQVLLKFCRDRNLNISIKKIERMQRNLENNGFTSFAEA